MVIMIKCRNCLNDALSRLLSPSGIPYLRCRVCGTKWDEQTGRRLGPDEPEPIPVPPSDVEPGE
jgi:hypothetical protein